MKRGKPAAITKPRRQAFARSAWCPLLECSVEVADCGGRYHDGAAGQPAKSVQALAIRTKPIRMAERMADFFSYLQGNGGVGRRAGAAVHLEGSRHIASSGNRCGYAPAYASERQTIREVLLPQ